GGGGEFQIRSHRDWLTVDPRDASGHRPLNASHECSLAPARWSTQGLLLQDSWAIHQGYVVQVPPVPRPQVIHIALGSALFGAARQEAEFVAHAVVAVGPTT